MKEASSCPLMMLIPILRLADNLDRSGDQRIQGIECHLHNGDVVLHVRSKGDIDLEQWGAERAAEVFQEIYQRGIALVQAKE